MHHDELWQVYHPNGEAIAGKGWDSALGNPEISGSKEIVGVAVVFLYRLNEKGKIELLWQKRSENVDRYPGDYDISAGGHINLGESITEGAIRECREEIGIDIAPEDLRFVTMRPFNRNRFAWIFLVDWTKKKCDFCFNDKEVAEVKWVALDEVDDFKRKYAKKPLKNDELTFGVVKEWLGAEKLVEPE